MEIKNPLYKNIGVHVICSLFTVDKGKLKVLLIKRKNDPFKEMWALPGGALYNNETIEDGIKREVFEKTGLTNVSFYFSNIVSDVDRSSIMRMIAVNYIGIIDIDRSILKNTEKTCDAMWVDVSMVGELAYDHEKILNVARDNLKRIVVSSLALNNLFPKGFTMPELQMIYESILDKKLDRRNFRKKILSLGLIEETDDFLVFNGKKPAKKYVFREEIVEKDIL